MTTATPADSATSSTPWGWIIAGVVAVAALAAVTVASVRRTRRRRAAERWAASAVDAYDQARLIDALVVRDPADSPELRRRISAARAAFIALEFTSPDLPSTQAAAMAASALDDLDTALNGRRVAGSEQLTVSQARDRLYNALAFLQRLIGTVAPPPPPADDPTTPR